MPHPRGFNRCCTLAGLIVLLLTVGYRTLGDWQQSIAQSTDFTQYYMGGLIARHGAWDGLYPIPNPTSRSNPGGWEDSTVRPQYAELVKQAGIAPNTSRYIQPPPFALLLAPISLLSYPASYGVWTLLLTLAAWGIGVQAGRIYTLSRGREDRLAGLITLIVCISPQAHRWARVANMSAFVGWVIGFVLLEIVRRDGVRGGVALAVGAIAKYAVIVLTPLHMIMGRWKTLAWTAASASVFTAISVVISGDGPYRVFLREILPTLGRSKILPENFSLYAFLLRISGTTDELALPGSYEMLFRSLEVLTLVVVLLTLFVRRKKIRTEARFLFAGAIALVSWLLIFSPIFWEHYHAYLGALWGWLVAEGTRSRGRMTCAVTAIVLTYVPWSIALRRLHLAQPPEPFYSHLLWATVLMLGMGIYSLLSGATNEVHPTVRDH